jgi:hypothetical protein
MPGGTAEIHYDTDPLMTGCHEGSAGTTLRKQGADFRSCGVIPGLAIYNDTTGTNTVVVSATETEVTTSITWNPGDEFSIYKTGTKDSFISLINVDLRFGQKVTRQAELTELGLKPDDTDIDETERNVFGPGQPEKIR